MVMEVLEKEGDEGQIAACWLTSRNTCRREPGEVAKYRVQWRRTIRNIDPTYR